MPALHVDVSFCTLQPFDGWKDVVTEQDRRMTSAYTNTAARERRLVGRARLRCVLSEFVAVKPQSLRFRRGRYGKLHLLGSDVRFNLSHSRDLVAIAVS